MSKPQVIVVPALAGIGINAPVQVPLSTDTITLVNLSTTLGLILCNDDRFAPTTTWPLSGGITAPQPGLNNLWVQNPNNYDVNVLVLEGIVPLTFSPNTFNIGGLLNVQLNITGTSTIQLLPAPPVGKIYRLQTLVLEGSVLSSNAEVFIRDSSNIQLYANNFASGTTLYNSMYLNGQLTSKALTIGYGGPIGITTTLLYDMLSL